MLAGQDAAQLDGEPENIGAEGLCPLDLIRLVRIVQNERVKVAVAGVKNVCHGKAVAVG